MMGGKHSELLRAEYCGQPQKHIFTVNKTTLSRGHLFLRLSVDSGAVHIIAQTTTKQMTEDKNQVNEQNILSIKHLNSKEQQKQPKISRVGTFDCEKKIM